MKILYLMSGAGLSGAEICLYNLTKEIIKSSQNPVIIINTEEGVLNEKFREQGIQVYIIPSIYVKKIFKFKEISKLIKNIICFRALIKRENPDIIHAFTLPLARRILLLKIIGIKVPVVGTIHDALTVEQFGARKLKMFIGSINKHYEKLISVSEATRQVAIANGVIHERVVVIHNGVSKTDVRQNLIKDKEFTIGCFGRIFLGKGQHIIIEAVNQLRRSIPNLRCFIIGEPPSGIPGSQLYYEALKKKVLDLKIESNVQFINWIDGLDGYYERLSVYVLSSVNHDPFPTVNLEAMLHKLPVIATDIGGSKEQIIDGVTGFLIEPGNPTLLAKKIMYLYNNPEIALKMGELGYIRVTEEFSIQKYVINHLRLYQECIHNTKIR